MSQRLTTKQSELLSQLSPQLKPDVFKKIASDLKAVWRSENKLNKVIQRKLVVDLKNEKVSDDLICQITHVPKKSLKRFYETWKNRPSYLDAQRSGRSPHLDKDQSNELQKLFEDNPELDARSIKKEYEKTAPLKLSLRRIQEIRKKIRISSEKSHTKTSTT